MSITDFLVICSGADRIALAQRPNHERQRAAAVGASVFLTGVFAFVSATYAGYLAFHSRPWAAVIGLTWGTMIFTVDRLLVLGVRRPSHRTLSPIERVRETRLAFVTTIPRLVLAVVIALPIAIPLELRFFERELDMELAHRRLAAVAQVRVEVERMYPELRTLQAKNAELQQRVIEKEQHVDDLLNAMIHEPPGNLTIRAERRNAYLQGRKELDELRRSVEQQVRANNDRLNAIRRVATNRESSAIVSIDTTPTFFARLDALNSLKANNRDVARFSTFLLLLFLVIQITPVLMQLLTSNRPNAEFWEAVAVMADLSQSHISPEHPFAMPDNVGRPPSRPIEVGVKPPRSEALRVFMCHCSEDKPVVRALTKQLHEAHVDPWLDEQRLLPGHRWEDEIAKAVRNSDAVIIFLSRLAVRKRGYVQREIRFAMDVALEQPPGSIFLIPAKLEECDVPLDLQRYQYVRMHESSGYSHLLASLRIRATELGRISLAQ